MPSLYYRESAQTVLRGAAAALVLTVITGCEPPPPLDHFLIYEVVRAPLSREVVLTDQFSVDGKSAEIVARTHFGTPVRKLHEDGTADGIYNGSVYHIWYELDQEAEEPVRMVDFENQFGMHSVTIDEPLFLLVPARLQVDPEIDALPVPPLDHQKCYQVVDVSAAPTPPQVGLGGYVGTKADVQIGAPVLFCLPVAKAHDGETVGRVRPDDHLAVYELGPEPVTQSIEAKDQFASHSIAILQRVWVAVPSRKLAVTEPTHKTGS